MITAYLHQSHRVGHIVCLVGNSSFLEIVREIPGGSLSCLLSGKGIRAVELVPTDDNMTTATRAHIAELLETNP